MMIKHQCRAAIWAMTLAFMPAGAWPQKQNADSPAALNSTQVVRRMQQHDQMQAEAVEHYHSLRHYEVEYRGFSKKVAAVMDVEVDYDASSGKHFRIVSQSGSKVLCEKVLKRAVESERKPRRGRRRQHSRKQITGFIWWGVRIWADVRPTFWRWNPEPQAYFCSRERYGWMRRTLRWRRLKHSHPGIPRSGYRGH